MSSTTLPVLTALGQQTRWRTFELLMRNAEDGMLQHEIADALGVPKNLLSVHLKVLQKAGLVSADRNGREVTFRAIPTVARDTAEAMLSLANPVPRRAN